MRDTFARTLYQVAKKQPNVFIVVADISPAGSMAPFREEFPEQFINVGSGSDISIRNLAEIIRQIVGFDGAITWDSSKPDGTPRKLMDSSRLFGLGWKPQIDLETGIHLAYEDYLTRFPASRV